MAVFMEGGFHFLLVMVSLGLFKFKWKIPLNSSTEIIAALGGW